LFGEKKDEVKGGGLVAKLRRGAVDLARDPKVRRGAGKLARDPRVQRKAGEWTKRALQRLRRR
jgi:hypothetical protein